MCVCVCVWRLGTIKRLTIVQCFVCPSSEVCFDYLFLSNCQKKGIIPIICQRFKNMRCHVDQNPTTIKNSSKYFPNILGSN